MKYIVYRNERVYDSGKDIGGFTLAQARAYASDLCSAHGGLWRVKDESGFFWYQVESK